MISGIESGLTYMRTVEEGEPMVPLCYIQLDERTIGVDGRELSKKLREGNPSIEAPYEAEYILEDYTDKLTLNPEYLLEGDEFIVIDRIKKIIGDM